MESVDSPPCTYNGQNRQGCQNMSLVVNEKIMMFHYFPPINAKIGGPRKMLSLENKNFDTFESGVKALGMLPNCGMKFNSYFVSENLLVTLFQYFSKFVIK